MNKIATFCFMIMLSTTAFSQENSDEDLIKTIQALSNYSVIVDDTEIQYITIIDLNRKTKRIRITETLDYSVKYIEKTMSFYIDDINRDSMKCILIKNESTGKFTVDVELSTLNNGVEYSEIVFEKGKESTEVSDLDSTDLVKLDASGNTMSKKSAKKYVNSFMKLLDIDHVIQETGSSN